MSLADYYLPVEVGESGCDPDFAVIREEQFDGVRAMVSERRVAVGLSALAAWDWTAAGNRIKKASMVNTLRTSVEAAIPYYLNTAIHAGGSIEGAASVTPWTKTTLFTAAGIGNGANWTNAPATYGNTLPSNTERLALHLNEIVMACQSLTHISASLSIPSGESEASHGTVGTVSVSDLTTPGVADTFADSLTVVFGRVEFWQNAGGGFVNYAGYDTTGPNYGPGVFNIATRNDNGIYGAARNSVRSEFKISSLYGASETPDWPHVLYVKTLMGLWNGPGEVATELGPDAPGPEGVYASTSVQIPVGSSFPAWTDLFHNAQPAACPTGVPLGTTKRTGWYCDQATAVFAPTFTLTT